MSELTVAERIVLTALHNKLVRQHNRKMIVIGIVFTVVFWTLAYLVINYPASFVPAVAGLQ